MASIVQGMRRDNGALLTVLLFVPPAVLLFTIFVILPLGQAAWFSLFKWNGLGWPHDFIGLQNYGRLLQSSNFRTAFCNNLLIIVFSIAIQLPLGLGMALLLARRAWGSVAFRLIFFLPYVLADVAAGLIFRFIFDGNYGPISSLIQAMGGQPLFMLADPNLAFTAIIIVVVWKYFGFHMMLYIAGLQGIDRQLYEAAEIDGANARQRFVSITLPQLAPMLKLSVFFSVIGALQLFDMIIPLTGGGPFEKTNTMVTFMYSFGITRMRVGYGSAVGVILFLVCVIFALFYQRILMRDE
ncbi:sugar ABC transporter permease [Acidisoma cellulosilytica]|uniref:Sugar ABC transporter permease n=1 Tax=Acidisoma cellulosilyticum TaxID=2802395 RepID=A0A964E4H1_9PROT|nr:sugar ABC transporter permease [Acidisoma cellulosilyticum]MCB8881461.1 sugar ABC transporter permease [Acidisoma cellulosilyticum]